MKHKIQRKKIKHLAVTAAIFNNDGKVLLSQRDEPRWTHSHKKWQFPGGTIEFGEHPEDAVIREVNEEVGLTIKLLTKNPLVHSFLFEKENIYVLLLIYPTLYLSGKIDIRKDPHTRDAKWFFPNDIDFSVCMPEVKSIIKKAQKYIIHNT